MLASLATTFVFGLSIISATHAAPSTPKTSAVSNSVYDQWVWVPVPGTMCSDGSVTGFAINLHQGSSDVVINFEEGGVCWDYNSCYVTNQAWNIGTPYNATTFANEGRAATLASYSLTTRYTSDNPFYQANMAWVPYCTGDLHAGNATNTYSPNTSPTFHHGYINGNLIMQAIKAAIPTTQRVWMTGSSAGGYGAIYQYPNAINTFGSNIRIDLLVDSAESYGSAYWYPSLNIQLVSKSLCPNCDYTRFDSFLPGYASARLSSNTGSRFAALSFLVDTVLPGYIGISTNALTMEILSDFIKLSASSNAKGFIARGVGHVVFGSPTTPSILGTSLSSFVSGMVNSAIWTGAT